ncbi:MAG: hypothetical protein KQJ78_19745 [Deltaproteobacteria bacterium]|nr:hypothetical protein [Deltaproteobacteria bacterium]
MGAQAAPREPGEDRRSQYRQMDIDGVTVFWHHNLMLVAPEAVILLSGFWKFRWISVVGTAAAAACSLA